MVKANEMKVKKPRSVTQLRLLGLLLLSIVITGCGGSSLHTINLMPAPAVFEDGALNGRAVHDGVTGAPIFEDAIAWMECEVRQSLDLGTHTLFIGELVAAAINDDDKRPASMSDTRMKYGGVKRGGHASS